MNTFTRSVQSAEQLLNDTIHQHVAQIEQYPQMIDSDRPFFVADIGEIRHQYHRWMSHLPSIRPFYGKMKPNLFMFS